MKVDIELEDLLIVKQQNEITGERLYYLSEKLKKLSITEKAYDLRTQEELADVKRLEELGLRSLFKKVLGDLEQAIEKERKEYLAAFLKHRSIEEEIELLEYEKKILQEKFIDPAKIDKDIEALIKKKEFLLKAHDSKFSKELFKRESELGRFKNLIHKANRAIGLADASSKIVKEIKIQLLELLDVQGWPIMNKGMYARVLKKTYIEKARAKAIQANVRLEEFGENVQKLFREKELKFDFKPFFNFLDNFYSNLITDYEIKNKLEATLQDLDDTLDEVEANKAFIVTELKKYDRVKANKEAELRIFIQDYKTKAST